MAIKESLHPTGRKGIFYKEHPTRKHGVTKDRQIVLRYTIGGKTRTESFKWLSEGYSLADAENKLRDFRANYKSGSGPTSIADEKEIERKIQNGLELQRLHEEQLLIVEQKKNIHIGDFFKDVYLPYAQAEKKPDTWGSEERIFRLWVMPVIGNLPFHQIAPFHLDKIKSNMRKGKREDTYKNSKPRPLSPKSILHALALIRQIWNHARREKVVEGDWPGRDVKKPKFDNRCMRFLTKDEADLLLAKLLEKSKQLHDISLISLQCGARASEIFTLRWDCVNFKDKTLLLTDTKNTKTRIAYMSPEVNKMLLLRREKTVENSTDSELVFCNTQGRVINAVSSTFARVVSDIGLNKGITNKRLKVTFHTLRHTYASWLVGEEVPLITVKELLGHKTLTMTVRYSHVDEKALKEATRTLATTISEHKKKQTAST